MSKLMWLGLALVFLGLASGLLEQTLYGGQVDENGVLQESLFLPVAFILIFSGAGLIVSATGRALRKRL